MNIHSSSVEMTSAMGKGVRRTIFAPKPQKAHVHNRNEFTCCRDARFTCFEAVSGAAYFGLAARLECLKF